MSKSCNKCSKDKSMDEFGNDSRNKDQKQSICYVCKNYSRRLKYTNNEEYREKEKNRQKKYNHSANIRARKHVKNLSDFYIIAELKRDTDLTTEDVKKHPELIETKRQILKNKRICQI